MKQRAARVRLPCQDGRFEMEVTDDGSRTLINKTSGVSYHSSSGAVSETRQVYLLNSGVHERLVHGHATRVLEIGLGTGMGMFLTLDHAINHGTPLDYVAVEYDWLNADVVQDLAPDSWVSDPALVACYLQWRSDAVPSEMLERDRVDDDLPHVFQWKPGKEQVVEVHCADALKWHYEGEKFDAIYFDPFAPDTNSDLWQSPMLEVMYNLMNKEGRFVTYCVKRDVRDRLTAVGFKVAKMRGPQGGKREVLVASKT